MLLRRLPGPRKRVGENVHTYAHARTKTIPGPNKKITKKNIYIYHGLINKSAPLASLNNPPATVVLVTVKLWVLGIIADNRPGPVSTPEVEGCYLGIIPEVPLV